MRQFYDENTDRIIDMEEVKSLYEEFHEDGETFAEFLNNATDKNGSLTEVFKFEVEILENGEIKTIAGYGANADDVVERYAIANDTWLYPAIIASRRV